MQPDERISEDRGQFIIEREFAIGWRRVSGWFRTQENAEARAEARLENPSIRENDAYNLLPTPIKQALLVAEGAKARFDAMTEAERLRVVTEEDWEAILDDGLDEEPPEPEQEPETTLHPAVEALLDFFDYDHLAEPMRGVSEQFSRLAGSIAIDIPDSAEKTTALRKLLEAKDCAVRAVLPPKK